MRARGGVASAPHYDVVIIGSGFGGSVTALRLSEKGYRVAVLEAGRRFADDEFATSTWDARRYLFIPALRLFGIQRITPMRHVIAVSGAGVGGGSLVYGNTLYEAPKHFFEDPNWCEITDWEAELSPWYDQAKRMLGVTTYDRETPADRVMKKVASDLGIAERWNPTPVAVVLGDEPGQEVGDPYFGGAGPSRRTCLHCGECMTGCRHNAKNTLTKNYLYLAEKAGTVVHPLTTVTDVRPRDEGGYIVSAHRTGLGRWRGRRSFTADHVVFSAAALGTQRLLHALRDRGSLPAISPRLGELTRTNSEAGVTVRARGDSHDFTEGVAITCSLHLDDHTHVEAARYGRGSGAMALAMAPLTDPAPGRSRMGLTLRELVRRWRDLPRMFAARGWAEQTVIVGVMQNHDNSLTTYTEPRRFGRGRTMVTRQGIGSPSPTFLPEANMVGRHVARIIDGIPSAGWNDALDRPISGHFLGGCAIAETPERGVVDPYHRLHGYPGLHVIDGSNIAANLGVNPSLTIVAMAERAASMWPNKQDDDPRPGAGEPYRPIDPVPPRRPRVPSTAPGALWTLAEGQARHDEEMRR